MKTRIKKFEIDIMDDEGHVIGAIIQDRVDPLNGDLQFHPDINLPMNVLKDVVKELGTWQGRYIKLNNS